MKELTKKALACSLKKMLEQKTLDKITVMDITEDCGVNRQTFYYHFQDIYALLEWIFANETRQAMDADPSYANWADCLLRVFGYLLENKAFITNVSRSISRDVLERYLYNVQRHYLDLVLAELDPGKRLPQSDRAFIENFFAYAIVGTILEWVKSGMKEDYHAIQARIVKLTAGDMEKYLA